MEAPPDVSPKHKLPTKTNLLFLSAAAKSPKQIGIRFPGSASSFLYDFPEYFLERTKSFVFIKEKIKTD